MSIQKLPSGQHRAQVYDPATGKNVSVSRVLTPDEMRDLGSENGSTFRLRRHAKGARERAREKLGARGRSRVTVNDFRDRWLNDPLFARPKESTMIHYAERTRAFAARYGHLPLDSVGDTIVGEWLAGGRRNSTVRSLRVMWNDARQPKAGRVATTNPWASLGLGIDSERGRKDQQPPDVEAVSQLIAIATNPNPRTGRLLVAPSFADYLEFASVTALRPGELDALRWPKILWDEDEIVVDVQWNVKAGKFTPPKYGTYRVALVARAREILQRARARRDNDSEFIFVTARGRHYTPSTRHHHWDKVRVKAGLEEVDFYAATRHHFGWYALNILDLDPAIIAEQFGHRDGGKLIEELYGHPDRRRRRAKLREAYDAAGEVRQLRVVEGGSGA